jgi:antitoxin ParD1/3/4
MDLTALPYEVKELVRAQLEVGRFQSVDEVVVEALRLLQEREELFAADRTGLRARIAEGVAAEERGELRDGREAIAAVRRRLDERLRSSRAARTATTTPPASRAPRCAWSTPSRWVWDAPPGVVSILDLPHFTARVRKR